MHRLHRLHSLHSLHPAPAQVRVLSFESTAKLLCRLEAESAVRLARANPRSRPRSHLKPLP